MGEQRNQKHAKESRKIPVKEPQIGPRTGDQEAQKQEEGLQTGALSRSCPPRA